MITFAKVANGQGTWHCLHTSRDEKNVWSTLDQLESFAEQVSSLIKIKIPNREMPRGQNLCWQFEPDVFLRQLKITFFKINLE